MINSTADSEERNHDLQTGWSPRRARTLEVQLSHGGRSPHATAQHTRRSITRSSVDTQLMAKGPFKVAHLSPAHSPPPHIRDALFMAPLARYKNQPVSAAVCRTSRDSFSPCQNVAGALVQFLQRQGAWSSDIRVRS